MYLEFWKLKKLPFENIPAPSFFYPSETHKEAMERMMYTVLQNKGACMIVGCVGCGKTMLSQAVEEKLCSKNYFVSKINNPVMPPKAFLELVASLFEASGNHADPKGKIWRAIEKKLEQNSIQGEGSVLIIDEAQTIRDNRTLEELRMLLNLQTAKKSLINLILLGQMDLEPMIFHAEPLNQRIALSYRLEKLTEEETVEYIKFRFKVAGGSENRFTDNAFRKIYEMTNGVPRLINNLCDRSLLAAFIDNKKKVDRQTVRQAWKDLNLQRTET